MKTPRAEGTFKINQISKSGMPFFCTLLDDAEGDLAATMETFKVMNEPILKKTGEIVKDVRSVGKLALSTNDDHMIIACYVPEQYADVLTAEQWLKKIMDPYKDHTVHEIFPNTAIGSISNKPENEVYVFKLRDEIISQQYAFLRKMNLLPPVAEEEEDDPLLGDELLL
jgi:hypothetical protein